MDKKLKLIDNIDQKLSILYKNMNKEEYYNFLYNNKDIKVYNDLLNNISLNYLPSSCLMVLPEAILLEINSKVFDRFIEFMNENKELVLC